MEVRIQHKDAFTVLGRERLFPMDAAPEQIPAFWDELFHGDPGTLRGMYGICQTEPQTDGGCLRYLIADDWDAAGAVPEGCVLRTIPAYTWAVFPCAGPVPQAIQVLSREVFSQWLPESGYVCADGLWIESYSSAPADARDVRDQRYTCQLWVAVKAR